MEKGISVTSEGYRGRIKCEAGKTRTHLLARQEAVLGNAELPRANEKALPGIQ
jgi:hypothetical protein